jgi:uncharacterized membrane protein
MTLTPLVAIHMSAALGALALGPVALWARQGRVQRPRLHRAFGYAWVTLMLATALSAIFIRDFSLPNWGGYTPIHLLVPVTLLGLLGAFVNLARHDVAGHAALMRRLYFLACVGAGVFTLLPGRYLGGLLWGGAAAALSSSHPDLSGDVPMLLQLVTHHPGAIAGILKNTPLYVWGILAGLLVLGATQVRDRSASLLRVSAMPLAMTAFSAWGLASAFGGSPLWAPVLALWLGTAAAVLAATAWGRANATYDAAARRYALPGSWAPLALIVGIFLTKYAVGVELALQPGQIAQPGFALPVAALYGVFSGLFVGRAARLWRLAWRPAARPLPRAA